MEGQPMTQLERWLKQVKRVNLNKPVKTAYDIVYKVQCKTFEVAKQMTGQFHDAVPMPRLNQPPYCLRIKKQYRTPMMQDFRDQVAREVRRRRC